MSSNALLPRHVPQNCEVVALFVSKPMVENRRLRPARLFAHILLLQTILLKGATSGPDIGDLGDWRRGKRASLFGIGERRSLISSKIFSSNAHTLAPAAVTERVDELLFRCFSNLAGEAYGERRKASSNPGKVRELGIINCAEVLDSVGQPS